MLGECILNKEGSETMVAFSTGQRVPPDMFIRQRTQSTRQGVTVRQIISVYNIDEEAALRMLASLVREGRVKVTEIDGVKRWSA